MTARTLVSQRRVAILLGLWLALPVLSVTYQVASKSLAEGLGGRTFGVDWLLHAISSPWAALVAGAELTSLAVWMGALSELKLSTAFLLTAFSYVLVVASGALLFHEVVDTLQLVGGAAILAGIALVATGDDGKAHP